MRLFLTTNNTYSKRIKEEFSDINEVSKFLANKGFYPIDNKKLFTDIINDTKIGVLLVDDELQEYHPSLLENGNNIKELESDYFFIKNKFGFFPNLKGCDLLFENRKKYEEFIEANLSDIVDGEFKDLINKFCEIFDVPNTKEFVQNLFLKNIIFQDIDSYILF